MSLKTIEENLENNRQITLLLHFMNQNEMNTLVDQIYAHFYWFKRNPQWFSNYNNKMHAKMKKVWVKAKKRLKQNRVIDELTHYGSIVKRSKFDCDYWTPFQNIYLRGEGWECYMQNASYHFLYVNEQTLELVYYVEGDVSQIECINKNAFFSERLDYTNNFINN